MSEHLAIFWLFTEGYEVFRNCGSTGPVDLMATREGETLRIDVKTVPKHKNGDYCFSLTKHEQKLAQGIKILWVDPLENKVGWSRDYF